MSEPMIDYSNSPTPTGRFSSREVTPDRGIGTDARGNLTYEHAAASGHVEVYLPSLPGSAFAQERLLVKDFGTFVAGKIGSSMTRQPYLTSGPQQDPAQTFRHYVACAKGASLMNADAIRRMETLAKEFAAEPDRAEFYSMVVRPYLLGLSPKRR